MLDVDKGELRRARRRCSSTASASSAVAPDVGARRRRGRSTSATSRCCPGLMDMEVNLLMGGPDHAQPARSPVQDDPAVQDAARRRQRPADAAGRVHDRAQPRPVRADRRPPARRRAEEGDRPRLDRRPPRRARRPRHLARPAATSTRRCSRRSRPHVLPLTVEEGIANGVDEVRKAVRYQIKHGAAAHQGVRVGRRDVAHRPGRRPAVLRRGAARPSPTRPTAPGSRWRPTPTATTASGPPSRPASTASSTAR